MLVEKFTSQLENLVVHQNVSIVESLEIMSQKRNIWFSTGKKKLQKAATYILEQLTFGSTLSDALRACIYLNFDEVYLLSLRFSETGGDLRKTLTFLKEREERKKNNRSKLLEACIYPFFVIILALGLCVFLFYAFPVDTASFESVADMKRKLVRYAFYLILLCTFLLFLFIKNVGEDKTYEAFYVISFLIKSGMNVSSAIECGQMVAGEDSKIGRKFAMAKDKIEIGLSFEEAFELKGDLCDALYFADRAGGKCDVFEKIAEWIFEKNEKKRNICLQLIEPVFIAVTGAFLLVLVMNFFMPFLNNTNWL